MIVCLPAVVWAGAGDCRYFMDNERFILAETGGKAKKKIFVWDRWQRSTHVIGEYATPTGSASGFSQAGMRPMWDRTGARIAFDSTHGGQGWQVRWSKALGLKVIYHASFTRKRWSCRMSSSPSSHACHSHHTAPKSRSSNMSFIVISYF